MNPSPSRRAFARDLAIAEQTTPLRVANSKTVPDLADLAVVNLGPRVEFAIDWSRCDSPRVRAEFAASKNAK